jgi:hypothetical protein
MIDDPNSIVLVSIDTWQPMEPGHAYEGLRKCNMYCHGKDQARMIVGVCSINLKPNSSFIGLAQDEMMHGDIPVNLRDEHQKNSRADFPFEDAFVPTSSTRDTNMDAARLYNNATNPAKHTWYRPLVHVALG